jgi:hypothetical protein
MEGEKIKVTAYAGYRGEEAPRAFELHGESIMVLASLATWLTEDAETRERRRYFRVRGSDSRIHDLCYLEKTMEWLHIESAPVPVADAGNKRDESGD